MKWVWALVTKGAHRSRLMLISMEGMLLNIANSRKNRTRLCRRCNCVISEV